MEQNMYPEVDLTDHLLVTDINELDEGEEFYVKFCDYYNTGNDGLCTVIKIDNVEQTCFLQKTYKCIYDFNYKCNFKLEYTANKAYLGILGNEDRLKYGIFTTFGINETCNIYKLTTNEYVLK
jgi:hypothetical protein